MYDCFVPTAGMHPTITKKTSAQLPAASPRPGKRELRFEGDQPPPSKKAREGAAPYPEPGRMGCGCPDVPMGETLSATSSTSTAGSASGTTSSTSTAGSASGATFEFTFRVPVPDTASSTALSSSTRSSGQPRPRASEIVDLTLDEDDEDVVMQARTTKEACPGQTGHEQSAAEDALVAESGHRQAQVTAGRGAHVHTRLALVGRQRRQEHRRQWMPWT